MKIAILGVTGRVGKRLATELLGRGMQVTGVARHVETAPAGVVSHIADVTQIEELVPLLRGHDAVVSATRFVGGIAAPVLVQAAIRAGVPRVLVVGGAGSLKVPSGLDLVDTPDFPAAYKAEAIAGRAFLRTLQAQRDIDWTFLSPSAQFAPGERTGKFRLGRDQLLVDQRGESHISMEDYAVALADELMSPRHSRTRFTVGY